MASAPAVAAAAISAHDGKGVWELADGMTMIAMIAAATAA